MQTNIESEEVIFDRLRKWNVAYRKGTPLVSDRVYDEEYDIAKETYPDNPFFDEVGFDITIIGDKERERELPIIMASMNKEKSMTDLKNWFVKKNIPITTDLVLTPKLDGMSLCVDEKTQQATTRGDGAIGQASDNHYKYIKNHLIDNIYFRYTYGEIMMRKDVFNDKYAIKFSNPRNLVAGMVNTPDATENLFDTAYIKYGAVPNDEFKNEFKTKSSILEALNKSQKIGVPFTVKKLSEVSEAYFIDLFKTWSVDYEIDGIILEVNDISLQQRLGRESSTENPVWARALKLPAFEQTAVTEVTHIEWNISKQGLLKPRLHVKPVKLDGVTVTHATANNARYVRDKGIGVGAVVKIVRSGMVIPKVVDVLTKVDFQMPDYANIGWNENGVELITLTATKEQAFKKIVSFFEILEVENAGEGVLKQLWDAGFTTVKSILELKPHNMEVLEGFGKRKSEIVYTSIQSKMKEVDLAKLQHASNCFWGLGSRKLTLLKDFGYEIKPDISEILKIEGFAEKSAEFYLKGFDKFKEFIKELPISIETKKTKTSNELEGNSFCFTGIRRKDLENIIENKGGKIAYSVSRNLNYLIAKDISSGSSKLLKAQELGVTLLSIEDLEKMINNL